jgi:hypothetical protein
MEKRIYRRKNSADSWHFCENCPGWPVGEFQEGTAGWGGLCSDCQALLLQGNCVAHRHAR